MNALRVQCLLKGILKEDEWFRMQQDIRFDYVSDSYFTESKEYEILKERFDVLREMNEYIGDYYSREYVRRVILRQSDEEIKELDKQITFERERGLLPQKTQQGF
jgi:hypothetical protein